MYKACKELISRKNLSFLFQAQLHSSMAGTSYDAEEMCVLKEKVHEILTEVQLQCPSYDTRGVSLQHVDARTCCEAS